MIQSENPTEMLWFAPPIAEIPAISAVAPDMEAFGRSDSNLVWKANMPLPRAPHLAEREELDAALLAGTQDALKLFLERHPESRYRDEAAAALARIINRAEPKRP